MNESNNKHTEKSPKIGKILLACWAVAVGLFILSAVLGLFIFGFKATDEFLFKYPGWILLVYMAISYPIVKKKLK